MSASRSSAMAEMTHLQTTRKVFTRWVNYHLREVAAAVDDCITGLRTGVVLAQLVDVLSGSSLARSKKIVQGSLDSLDRPTRIHNVHVVLMYLGNTSLPLNSVDAETFVDGKTAAVLQFVWSLILHFEVKPIIGASTIKSVAHVCKALVGLVHDTLPGYASLIPMASFPHDFKSGLVLAALFHVKDFRSIDLYTLAKSRASRAVVFQALAPLLDALDVPLIVDLADFDVLDDSLFVTFFCAFWRAYTKYNPERMSGSDDPASSTSGVRAKLTAAYAKISDLEAKLADANARIASVQEDAEDAANAAARNVARKDESLKLATQDVRQLEMVVSDLQSQLDVAFAQADATERALQATLDLERERAAAQALQNTEPPDGAVTLVYVAIEGGLSMWETAPDVMSQALILYHHHITSLLRINGGYLVRSEGDNALAAFSSGAAATTFSLLLHLALLDAKWDDALCALPPAAIETDLAGNIVFRGLRACIGVHGGVPVRNVDPSSGRVDYVGPVLATVVALAAAANGGQTLISDDTFDALEPNLFSLRVTPSVLPLGVVTLPSISRSCSLYQILPERVAERRFRSLCLDGPDGPDGAGTAGEPTTSPTERKMMLLVERNTKFSTKLKSLSTEVQSASSSARKLMRALGRVQYSTTGEMSRVMREFMDELDAVTSAQKALNTRLNATCTENEAFAEHLAALETAFGEEMVSARSRIKERERQLSDLKARQTETIMASETLAARSVASQEFAALKTEFDAHKRKSRNTHNSLRAKIRSLQDNLKATKKKNDILKFKLRNAIIPDKRETVPLHSILADDSVSKEAFAMPPRHAASMSNLTVSTPPLGLGSATHRVSSRSNSKSNSNSGSPNSGSLSKSKPLRRSRPSRASPTSQRVSCSPPSPASLTIPKRRSRSRPGSTSPKTRLVPIAVPASVSTRIRTLVDSIRESGDVFDAPGDVPRSKRAHKRALADATHQLMAAVFEDDHALPLAAALNTIVGALASLFSGLDLLYVFKLILLDTIYARRVGLSALGPLIDSLAEKHNVFAEPGWKDKMHTVLFTAAQSQSPASSQRKTMRSSTSVIVQSSHGLRADPGRTMNGRSVGLAALVSPQSADTASVAPSRTAPNTASDESYTYSLSVSSMTASYSSSATSSTSQLCPEPK